MTEDQDVQEAVTRARTLGALVTIRELVQRIRVLTSQAEQWQAETMRHRAEIKQLRKQLGR